MATARPRTGRTDAPAPAGPGASGASGNPTYKLLLGGVVGALVTLLAVNFLSNNLIGSGLVGTNACYAMRGGGGPQFLLLVGTALVLAFAAVVACRQDSQGQGQGKGWRKRDNGQ